MTALNFPVELRCICALGFLEVEHAKFCNLSEEEEDISAKRSVGQKIRKLTNYLKSYSMDLSIPVDLEAIEKLVKKHEIRLFAEEDISEEILTKMTQFLILFKTAKMNLPVGKSGSQVMKPFSKVNQVRLL